MKRGKNNETNRKTKNQIRIIPKNEKNLEVILERLLKSHN